MERDLNWSDLNNLVKKNIRISASRIKSLLDCSYAFYLKEIEKFPDETHWKTLVGSAVHSIFECMMHLKRRKTFLHIIENGFLLGEHPNIIRYIHFYCRINNVTKHTLEEFDEMLRVAFMYIAQYFKENPNVDYTNEERFQIKIGFAEISGFIDLLIKFEDKDWVIVDLKSQGKRFTETELADNVQAVMYQLAVWKTYQRHARVDFIMLRHAPTTRTPDKHIQTVPRLTLDHFDGFESYLKHLYDVVQNFGHKEAHGNFCKKPGFCDYVCKYKKAFEYKAIINIETGDVIRSYFVDQPHKLESNERMELRKYTGCPKFY